MTVPRPPEARELPGEGGIWVLAAFELSMFVAAFGSFLWSYGNDVATYASSQEELTLAYAVLNTVVLLTSSWLVARAVLEVGSGRAGAARRSLALAMVCGVVFLGLKGLEWATLLADDHGPGANVFFQWYFTLTGLHIGHLVVGLAVLAWVRRLAAGPEPSMRYIEVGATYWHLVDLVWILLFAVLYLVH